METQEIAHIGHVLATEVVKHRRDNEFFARYHRAWVDPHHVVGRVQRLVHITRVAGVEISRAAVLDAGCGFGLTMVIFSLLGARAVCGVEQNAEMCATSERFRASLPLTIKDFDVCCGDIMRLPEYYPEGSFDVAFCNEAISHFRTPSEFLSAVLPVLKRGGTLVISDGHNAMNPGVRREIRQIWKRFEEGPPCDDFHGHKIGQPFVVLRQNIIRESFPDLDENVVRELARRTAGLGEKEILEEVGTYLAEGTLPTHFLGKDDCPFDPVYGQFAEQLIHPFDLAGSCIRAGFSTVKVYPSFGGWRGGVYGLAERLLGKVTFLSLRMARTFFVVARK